MLKHLSISNFAIIESIELDFHDGLTVLSGETGAGKSILIDAISLVLGERASSEMIRTNTPTATIKAVFSHENEAVSRKLAKLGLDFYANEFEITRTISQNGKNTIQINQKNVTLQDLKELSGLLADIHSQFDTQRLIHPSNYVELIDNFKRSFMDRRIEEYKEMLSRLRQKVHEAEELKRKKEDFLKKQEIHRFQLNELQKLNLSLGEEESLREEEHYLENFDKIYSILEEIKATMESDEFAVSFSLIKDHFDRLGDLGATYKEKSDQFKDHYYELWDLMEEVSKESSKMNFDPQELNRISERLHLIQSTKEKYKMTSEELLEHITFLKKAVEIGENVDEYIEKTTKEANLLLDQTLVIANDLTSKRKSICAQISADLKVVLNDLALPNTQFEIQITPQAITSLKDIGLFMEYGIDTIEFLISPNVGEAKRPLSKSASGGEMSRIMLGFKAIMFKSAGVGTVIFDEIDTGISGAVAKKIARKMEDIAQSVQVLSITHIPQVVARGKHHLKVEKKEVSKRTMAFARYLSSEERIEEIAKMISSDKPTQASMQSARELLFEE